MYILGLTGGIGSGKSTAGAILAGWGLPVIDADQLSHEVTAAGGEAMTEILDTFGPDCITPEGALDRQKMAQRVFTNKNDLDRLSRIVHQYVFLRMDHQLKALQKRRAPAVVLEVPLPVREGFLDRCHHVLTVQAPESIRLERLIQRGMEPAQAQLRMAQQLDPQAYADLADQVIDNAGTREALEAALKAGVVPLLKARGIQLPGLASTDTPHALEENERKTHA